MTLLRSALAALRRRRRRPTLPLALLDARALRDIGLSPSDAPSVVCGAFTADPTRRSR